MSKTRRCATCHAALPGHLANGLCPTCLIRMVLSELEAELPVVTLPPTDGLLPPHPTPPQGAEGGISPN